MFLKELTHVDSCMEDRLGSVRNNMAMMQLSNGRPDI
jgi:hypothetical protein